MRIAVAGALAGCLLALLHVAPSLAAEGRAAVLARMAAALVGQIATADSGGAALRLALLPFEPDDVPLTPPVAGELHAGMLAALVAVGQGRIELVARDSLAALIADLDRTDAGDAVPEDPALAVLRRARDIDLLALGRMRRVPGGVMLSYRAIRVAGSDIVASTAPLLVPLTAAELDPTAAQLSLDQAVEAAAGYFLLHAGDLSELRLGGIRFETSGAQPPFGRYLQDRLAATLEAALANPLSQRRLILRPHPEPDATPARGSYALEGRYWDFGEAIEIRLRLSGAGGRTLSWRDRVLRASAGPLRLRPKGDFGNLRDNDGIGPFAFRLTSDRGDDPAYRIGDDMDLRIEAERDIWLYCFHLDAAGVLTQFIPNPHLAERHGASIRIAGGLPVGLTEQALREIVLRIAPPAGQELVKCFAAGRDITVELPPPLRGSVSGPVPPELAGRLSRIFRDVAGGLLNEASVVVTVHE